MNPSSNQPLNILLWNANSLTMHRNELETLLHENIDTALIRETPTLARAHAQFQYLHNTTPAEHCPRMFVFINTSYILPEGIDLY